MIHELVTVLGLTAEDRGMSTDQWDTIMAMQTFVTVSIWNVVKTKVFKFQGINMLHVKRSELFQLLNLLPAVDSVDTDLLDMDRKNIDGICLLEG